MQRPAPYNDGNEEKWMGEEPREAEPRWSQGQWKVVDAFDD